MNALENTTIPEDSVPSESRFIWRYVAGLTAVAQVAVLLVAVLYIRLAPGFLAKLDLNVGEVLMKEGIRFEDAGAIENAKERYTLALDARFAGPQNRVFTLKRLGTLLLNEGQAEKGVVYLQQALDSPYASLTAYEPLLIAYYQLNRLDDAERILKQWQQAATNPDNALRATFCFHAGRIAHARGDDAAALTHFQEGQRYAPGGANASELGSLYYQQRQYADAIAALDSYLNSGASGERAEYARKIRAQSLKMLNAQGK
ncbi:MAG TPA: hypothetical protein PLI09_13435 [Candidatus Hydrogenedentes bacterium]|nr:hypothetical protein [Candidatus Hydrogenedentota bacterium]